MIDAITRQIGRELTDEERAAVNALRALEPSVRVMVYSLISSARGHGYRDGYEDARRIFNSTT